MRGCRWLSIRTIGLVSCLLAGCLRHTLPPEVRMPRSNVSAQPRRDASEEESSPPVPSDYLVSRSPSVELDVQPTAATDTVVEKLTEQLTEKQPEESEEKTDEPAEMGSQSAEPSSPNPPVDPPETRKEAVAAPLSRPEAPSVQVLRALLDHRPEEEINEQLRPYDPLTREAMLVLLSSIVQLQQNGGVERMSPRDLAVCTDRLNTLSTSLRGRAQLILERMCFCRSIKNFGDYAPLPPEHGFFQPGEVAHIYVQVRNISNRRLRDKYVTVLKGRFEIYDENSRAKPPITWASPPRKDVSASPRQDYYINFQFRVPRNCPAGLYTMRIFVEDWTDAPSEAKQVSESRIAQRTLDFRVGGPIARTH
ncbi:MAG: hypothetical protein ACRELF_04690 [Gemmataceae bacterium]